MNLNTTEEPGSWSERKSKLRQKLALLTDNDLKFENCTTEEIFDKLEAKLGKTKDELRKIIASL